MPTGNKLLHWFCRFWFWPVLSLYLVIALSVTANKGNPYALLGCLLLGALATFLYAFRPGSRLFASTLENHTKLHTALTLLLIVVILFLAVYPMGFAPLWNGEIPDHRNQYEVMAEALLEGHLYLSYEGYDPTDLEKLNNPYDPNERQASGIAYKWDHAYYNGHYYMYFGIVPVLLVFLPYRVLTGQPLTTYYATALFTAIIVLGIFMLFYLLGKVFFPTLPYGIYLALSGAFSLVSVWYFATTPALYCTAISSAVAMMTVSFLLYFKGVYIETRENRQLIYAFFGAVFGALAFGCRPPVALANLLVLPMLIAFLGQRRVKLQLVLKLVLCALPYVLVAVGLMVYNAVRFDSPFEFGQTYQLTICDQTQYASFFDAFDLQKQISGMTENFFAFYKTDGFPYVYYSGAFMNFPVFFLIFACVLPCIQKQMRQAKMRSFFFVLLSLPLIITFMDVLWSPFLLERYRTDIYFLLCMVCFLVFGFLHGCLKGKARQYAETVTLCLAVFTAVKVLLLFCVPFDGNYASSFPDVMKKIESVIFFWR